jgi:lysozyme
MKTPARLTMWCRNLKAEITGWLTRLVLAPTATTQNQITALSGSYGGENQMNISGRGLEVLKRFEGLKLKAYFCPAGVLTIGYGSTGPHVKMGMEITPAEAEKLLLDDVARFERAVNRLVKVPLTQGQFDALVCFSYNIGIGAFEKSTLLSVLNMGRYGEVISQFKRWNKVKGQVVNGLVNRRAAEIGLWES